MTIREIPIESIDMQDRRREDCIQRGGPVGDLSQSETVRLAECEATIERGLAAFVELGQALLEIRDERLYRARPSRSIAANAGAGAEITSIDKS